MQYYVILDHEDEAMPLVWGPFIKEVATGFMTGYSSALDPNDQWSIRVGVMPTYDEPNEMSTWRES